MRSRIFSVVPQYSYCEAVPVHRTQEVVGTYEKAGTRARLFFRKHLNSFLCFKWAGMRVTLRHSKGSPQRAHNCANPLAFASFLRSLFRAVYIKTFPYGTVPVVHGLNEHGFANTSKTAIQGGAPDVFRNGVLARTRTALVVPGVLTYSYDDTCAHDRTYNHRDYLKSESPQIRHADPCIISLVSLSQTSA